MAAHVDERARRWILAAIATRPELLIHDAHHEQHSQRSEHDHTSIVVDLVRPRH
jgi:hypothetical protein